MYYFQYQVQVRGQQKWKKKEANMNTFMHEAWWCCGHHQQQLQHDVSKSKDAYLLLFTAGLRTHTHKQTQHATKTKPHIQTKQKERKNDSKTIACFKLITLLQKKAFPNVRKSLAKKEPKRVNFL